MFLLYINDLPNCLTDSYPRMYADDTHLTYSDKDVNIIQSCLNEDLLNISKWLIVNKLTLNMTKTEFMLLYLPVYNMHPYFGLQKGKQKTEEVVMQK